MHKHRIIISVVFGVTVLLASILLFDPTVPPPPPPPPGDEVDSLDSSINCIGAKPYDQAAYDRLKTYIMNLRSIGSLDPESEQKKLETLELNMQLALANSVNQWFIGDCAPGDLREIKRLADKCNVRTVQLKEALKTYHDYEIALGYKVRLNKLLSSKIDFDEIDKINLDYYKITSGKPFASCPIIFNIKEDINRKTTDFKEFYRSSVKIWLDTSGGIIKVSNPQITRQFFRKTKNNSLLNKLMNYSFYYNLIMTDTIF